MIDRERAVERFLSAAQLHKLNKLTVFWLVTSHLKRFLKVKLLFVHIWSPIQQIEQEGQWRGKESSIWDKYILWQTALVLCQQLEVIPEPTMWRYKTGKRNSCCHCPPTYTDCSGQKHGVREWDGTRDYLAAKQALPAYHWNTVQIWTTASIHCWAQLEQHHSGFHVLVSFCIH